LEHVDDPNGLLQAVHRVLADGGILFIEVPNLESFMMDAIRLYFRLRKRDWSPLLSPLHWPYHCYGYSLNTLRYLCQRNGFRMVKANTVDLGPRGFRENRNVDRWEQQLRATMMKLGGLVGRGDVLMVWCRKTSSVANSWAGCGPVKLGA
jgi:SAM-dependent methyltransferase